MTVALDATPLTLTSGGLARYTAELSLTLAREFPDDRFVLMSDQEFRVPAGAPANLVAHRGTWRGKRWWLTGVRRAIEESGAKVFHGTNFEVPMTGKTPAVMTIHDLSPWHERAWHPGPNRVRRRMPWLLRLGRAQRIITVSKAVRSEVVRRFGVNPENVRVVPLAAAPKFRPVEVERPARPYFLFVGTLEPRKNIEGLLEAWRISNLAVKADLLIAGRRREDYSMPELAEGVRLLGEPKDDELPGLYSGATALVYPTHYEGFGLPVLEAMQCGCPVITSHDPAVVETAGGAAIHAGTAMEIAAAMKSVELGQLRERGLARAGQFSWQRTARETMKVYRE